ncbi:MAG: ATP-binding cassette domain-containing protein, partial [Alphaproteobacteria bacterium]|nr:ATP-binding cassette domain-containing protein [Alphaproteobacteria bacterium]
MLSFDILYKRDQFNLNAKAEWPIEGIIGIIGPSGSGKTTLAQLLAGILKPKDGLIKFGDQIFFDQSQHIYISPEKRRFSYIFQEPRLFDHLNVYKNLIYGYKRCATSQRKLHPDDIIKLLNLDNFLKRKPEYLSGGEKRLVSLGRALLANPQAIIMDEPLTNIDTQLKYKILNYIEQIPN